jgi:hypothetical protein
MTRKRRLKYREVIRQPYTNCYFAAGLVDGHPVDTIYLKLKRKKQKATVIILRPDEALALAWCLIGAAWSKEIARADR